MAVLEWLQDDIRRRLTERSIAVKINPTSNLLIAPLGDLEAHPLWRLRFPNPKTVSSLVTVCISSDDPATFATTIREEYQLLVDTLISGGLSADEAHLCVDHAPQAGLNLHFSLPQSLAAPLA